MLIRRKIVGDPVVGVYVIYLLDPELRRCCWRSICRPRWRGMKFSRAELTVLAAGEDAGVSPVEQPSVLEELPNSVVERLLLAYRVSVSSVRAAIPLVICLPE